MAAKPAGAAAEEARWDADADEAADVGEPRRPERILNQDEIDSLLGFSLSEEEGGRTGVRAIINSTLVSDERLPVLETVFDRLARLMATSLRNFTSNDVEVSIERIASIRFGDCFDAIAAPAISAVFRTKQLDNSGLVTADASLIRAVVDALQRGRRGGAPTRIEGRPYTTIELMLVTRMIEVILADAREAFAPLTQLSFNLERIETDPRCDSIACAPSAAVALKLRINMQDRGGRLELVLPYATLEPIRKMPLQQFTGGTFGHDHLWAGRLASELWAARLEVRAVLDDFKRPLRKVLDLKVGDTLMLDARPDTQVKLKCGAVDLSVGRVGRVGQSLAVMVERQIAPAAQHAVMKLDGCS